MTLATQKAEVKSPQAHTPAWTTQRVPGWPGPFSETLLWLTFPGVRPTQQGSQSSRLWRTVPLQPQSRTENSELINACGAWLTFSRSVLGLFIYLLNLFLRQSLAM